MKKFLLLVMVVFTLAGCGGGGGDGTTANTSTGTANTDTTSQVPLPVITKSIVDGTWRIVPIKYDNILDSIAHMNDPDPTFIRTMYFVKFENGKMRAEYIASTVYIKEGVFSINGNTLTYTLNYSLYDSSPLTHPIIGSTNNTSSGIESQINQSASFQVSVSTDSMIWKDNAGATIMTFTK